ncbi:glucose-1-phosphate thymidylyltransferase [candidate division MSBL1 archaeon SCGC-AAA259A05]|uniref:Glucose-1-phosphate thymidylyltransferase n=1 Tax=candidate division MSBL1 archaeon SCGC-AAA259A05 TaxID=1698259 RepID=A0A133UBX0_9EURY|nr:glucose-1-phosphate thymidylyltransferase [candidate division MSBL1 archaeon SCGC-AAA259A05]
MKGIVLHGGHGTRLRPLTHTGPKQLIPVANKPISQYVLEDLKESGIEDIAIVVGHIQPEEVKDKYGDGRELGLNITYIKQEEPKGIAQAVGLCEDFVGEERFVVYLGDNLIKDEISRLVDKFDNSDSEALIFLNEVEDPTKFGVAEFDEKDELVNLIEKPDDPPSNYALTGIYFFTPKVFEMINQLEPSWRGELEITEAIQMLLDEGYEVEYDVVEGWWKDTGTPRDVLAANRLILDDDFQPELEGEIEDRSQLQGRVSLGENSKVEANAKIRGPVVIGKNSVIKSGVYIGPYTSIGNNVKIKNGEIENSILMDNCLVDIDERILNSLIGNKCEITAKNSKPTGKSLVIGDSSKLRI